MEPLNKPLTNLQIELLRLYSLDLSEKDLLQLKRVIARYFADKASDEMDRLWKQNNWTDKTMDQWLKRNTEANKDQ